MKCSQLTRAGKPCPCSGNFHISAELHRERSSQGGKVRAKAFTSEYQQVARSHVKRESLQRAGRAGFDKVGGMEWWALQTEKARLFRLAHPSAHEKILREVLTQTLALDVHCDFEVIVEGDPRAVDAVLYVNGKPVAAIEYTESAGRATFGRDEKLKQKIEWLEGLDLVTHVFYGGDDLQTELDRLGKFLAAHDLIS